MAYFIHRMRTVYGPSQSPSASRHLEPRHGREKGNAGANAVPSSSFPREWEQREAATCSSDKVPSGVCVCVWRGVCVRERDREIFHTKARVPPSHPLGGCVLHTPPHQDSGDGAEAGWLPSSPPVRELLDSKISISAICCTQFPLSDKPG